MHITYILKFVAATKTVRVTRVGSWNGLLVALHTQLLIADTGITPPPTILYCTVLYCTVLYCTVLYYTILYYTILYYTILCYTMLYYTILYYAMLCYDILCSSMLCYAMLCYAILYYTILYYNPPTHFSLGPRVLRGARRDRSAPSLDRHSQLLYHNLRGTKGRLLQSVGIREERRQNECRSCSRGNRLCKEASRTLF